MYTRRRQHTPICLKWKALKKKASLVLNQPIKHTISQTSITDYYKKRHFVFDCVRRKLRSSCQCADNTVLTTEKRVSQRASPTHRQQTSDYLQARILLISTWSDTRRDNRTLKQPRVRKTPQKRKELLMKRRKGKKFKFSYYSFLKKIK